MFTESELQNKCDEAWCEYVKTQNLEGYLDDTLYLLYIVMFRTAQHKIEMYDYPKYRNSKYLPKWFDYCLVFEDDDEFTYEYLIYDRGFTTIILKSVK